MVNLASIWLYYFLLTFPINEEQQRKHVLQEMSVTLLFIKIFLAYIN